MSCIRLVGFPVLLGTLISHLSCGVASAALLSHFTFDSDFTNVANASRDATGAVGASIDNSQYKVGGGSVLFDGGTTPEYVVAGSNAVPGIQGGYFKATVALWFKIKEESPGVVNAGSRVLLGQANGNPATFGADDRMAFDLETQSDGKLRAFIRVADNGETNNRLRFAHDTADPIERLKWADGDWHHLAYCWDVGVTSNLTTFKMWIDGALVPTIAQENALENDPAKGTATPWETPGMYIGALNNRTFQGGPGATGHVNGWMDDLRVYDECLTDAQVFALSQIPEPNGMVLITLGLLGLLATFSRRHVM